MSKTGPWIDSTLSSLIIRGVSFDLTYRSDGLFIEVPSCNFYRKIYDWEMVYFALTDLGAI